MKFECRKDIHYKTKPRPVAKNATPRPSGWELNPRPLDLQTNVLATDMCIYIYMVMPVKYSTVES